MSSENQIYRHIGLFIVVIIVAYIGIKTLKFQYKVIEGLTNSDVTDSSSNNMFDVVANKAYDAVKNRNNKIDDIISLDKYRDDYENLIISMEEYAKTTMLSKVITIASTVGSLDANAPLSNDIINDIESANKLHKFVDTLNASMDYIDNKKTKTGYF
jgi:hypothetical protein